jgi:hypothetical protein
MAGMIVSQDRVERGLAEHSEGGTGESDLESLFREAGGGMMAP